MTLRQKFLKLIYPLIVKATKRTAKIMANTNHTTPTISFYDLSVTLNTGKVFSFANLKGKNVLLVNTASDCGYTNQYEALQQLYTQRSNDLVIVGFPANDFKEQEKGTDAEIAEFCKINYGVTFPLAQKTTVIQTEQQHPVYQWLSSTEQNGWCNQVPTWNFSKYLVNREGVLTHYFDPGVSPLDAVITTAL